MPCVHRCHLKLPCSHCRPFSTLIRGACARCHGSCLRTRSPPSSEDDSLYVILKEIRSRMMKTPPKPDDLLSPGSLSWSPPPSARIMVPMLSKERDGEEELNNSDGESQAFFSVNSCFSRSPSERGPEFGRHSVLEEFRHCKGWPFGLGRRAAVLPPPLLSTPSDSWLWRRRRSNLAATRARCTHS